MAGIVESDLEPEVEQLAQSLVDALEAGDVDAWRLAFSSDAVTWHSQNGEEMSATANAEILRGVFAAQIELSYKDIRRHRIAGGYLQQHTLLLQAKTGATYRSGVCMVIHVADGHVTRIDEYLDSSVQAFGREHAVRR